jgi:hypothetical protein
MVASKHLLPRPWRTHNLAVAPRLIPESRVHLTRPARHLQPRLREVLRMTEPYLPDWATAAQACAWLEYKTGSSWPPERLLDAYPRAALRLKCPDDVSPYDLENVFMGRREDVVAPVENLRDRRLLAFDGEGGTLTMTRRPDGAYVRLSRPYHFKVSDLKFEADDIRSLAAHPGQSGPTPKMVRVQFPDGQSGFLGEEFLKATAARGGMQIVSVEELDVVEPPPARHPPASHVTPPTGGEQHREEDDEGRSDEMKIELLTVLEEMAQQGIQRATPGKVMPRLRSRAGQPNSCITDVAPDGVIWRDASGNHKKMTTDGLKLRLFRLRQGNAKER